MVSCVTAKTVKDTKTSTLLQATSGYTDISSCVGSQAINVVPKSVVVDGTLTRPPLSTDHSDVTVVPAKDVMDSYQHILDVIQTAKPSTEVTTVAVATRQPGQWFWSITIIITVLIVVVYINRRLFHRKV